MSMHKGILGQQFGGATVTQEQTLGEYINRKQRAAAFDAVAQEKKMTFEEWWTNEMHWQFSPELGDVPEMKARFQQAWKAAQENV